MCKSLIKIYPYSTLTGYTCSSIYGFSSSVAFVALATTGNLFKYMRVDMTALKYQMININNNAFTTASSNTLTYSTFKNGLFYITGYINSYSLNSIT